MPVLSHPRRGPSARYGLFLCLALVVSAANLAAQQTQTPDNPLIVRKNQDVAEDIIVFSRSVLVQGVARQGIAAFGGSVTVEGTVRGDVAVVGGTLDVRDGGIIHGDVIVVGGRLERSPLGRVDGRVVSTSVYEEKLINMFQQPSRELLRVDYSMRAMGWRMLRAFTWFILSLLLFRVFPLQVSHAARRMRYDLPRISAVGMAAALSLVTLLFVFLVLCIILIGVPLIIIWLLFCASAWIFGSVAFYYFLGQLLGGALLRDRTASPAALLLVGVVVYALLRLIPVLTLLLPYVVLILGLGVVVSTKFGTGATWFRRPAAQEPVEVT